MLLDSKSAKLCRVEIPEGRQVVRDASRCGLGRRVEAHASRQPDDPQRFRDWPGQKIKLLIVYPMTTGRNFDEVLRVIDSLQLTAKHRVATPVNWKPGEDVIIAGSVSDDEAKKIYPRGWKAPRPYLRIVPQPK